jgi:peptidoglycan/xylan/chitin deacetylase (PgdA/CDA1 family)
MKLSKNILKGYIYRKSIKYMPLKLKLIIRKHSPLILFFHEIGESKDYISNLYSHHSEKSFYNIIEQLLKYFKPLKDLSVHGFRNASSRDFVVTFDDGLLSHYEIVAPFLEKKGIPAIFFLNSDFINKTETFYRFEASLICELLKSSNQKEKELVKNLFTSNHYNTIEDINKLIMSVKYKDRNIYNKIFNTLDFDSKSYFVDNSPFMSISNVKDLINRGFYIGAHSCNHYKYSEISLKEQINQTISDMIFWQKELNLDYKYFAFPFNDFGVHPNFYNETKSQIDLFFNTAGMEKPNYRLNLFSRICMDNSNNLIKKINSFFN